MKFFLPKQMVFFDLLKELNGYKREMAILFAEFVDNFNDFEKYAGKAKEIEHRADDKAHEIIKLLNKTFVTPLDREDIYLLTKELDDIIDYIENVIHNIQLYGITEKKEAVNDFKRLILEASEVMEKLMSQLQKQKHTTEVNGLIIKIHGLEDQGDLVYQKAISRLFREEKDPVAIIKWKDIFGNLEKIMDKFQAVSDTIEGIIIKAS